MESSVSREQRQQRLPFYIEQLLLYTGNRFTLCHRAMENSVSRDYVAEKLWHVGAVWHTM